MQGEHVQGLEAVPDFVRRGYELAGLLRGERLDLWLLRSRSLHAGGVALNQPVAHGLRERLVERHVDVVDRARGKPRIELLPVQCANVVRGERLELHAPKGRLDVYPDYGLVTLERPLPH